jgi:hypothetical protein
VFVGVAAVALLMTGFTVSSANAVTGCTQHSMASAQPGDVVVCLDAAKTKRLKITKGGTPDKPVTYSGAGQEVGGIEVEADNVIVDGYTIPSKEGSRLVVTPIPADDVNDR